MNTSVDFESVLSLIDKTISPTYLNPTQEIVLREVWNGKTYSKMAYDYNYDPEYIKTVGCNLWQTLSSAFDEQINKGNFVPFMRLKISQLVEDKISRLENYQSQSISTDFKKRQSCNWTTAPNTNHFVGRESEIKLLKSWSQDSDCRCIVVSGMIGCGKTSLVTKFAQDIKDNYDFVIWFSLHHTPSLKTLLHNYLKIIKQLTNEQIHLGPVELSFLLSEFIDCLKQHKVLLVLDSLQSILETNRKNVSYKKEFDDYSQFLRSIISTNHQSLLISASRIKPKSLEYYTSNQVKILDLQGFNQQTTKTFLNLENNSAKQEQQLLRLSVTLQNNPQLLKIVENHLDIFSDDNTEQILQDLSLLEAISNLLEQELSYLSELEKEIIYWLAISCAPISLTELSNYLELSQPKLTLSHSVNCLTKRSLIIQNDAHYSLMPIMKSYLRRKLIKQALQSKSHH
ncbi:AAA family ATPase [Pleurocapsa sp. PCC 7319]|uniref:AAA family ATPase n=1 Tax=Pleurocapsa sp. PCC 7319 TaxID=118161 RepID=UPI00034958F1|nr:ATP-binding protein [Pleurocapsa sp. PCC 7319]